MREINEAGVNLIKSFEGIVDGDPSTVKLDPYLDPIQIWTIGWGHAISVGTRFLKGADDKPLVKAMFPDGITLEEATLLLKSDLLKFTRGVESVVKVPLTDNQFAALVSFAFNVGLANLMKSTLLRRVNEQNFAAAALEFQKWNKAGGKVLRGLTRRRAAEAQLFLTP
jgi:lysozyme